MDRLRIPKNNFEGKAIAYLKPRQDVQPIQGESVLKYVLPAKSNSQVAILKKPASSNVVAVLKKRDASNETFVGVVAPDLSEDELEPAPQHFEEGVTVTTKHLLEVNLGDAS